MGSARYTAIYLIEYLCTRVHAHIHSYTYTQICIQMHIHRNIHTYIYMNTLLILINKYNKKMK